MVGIVDQAGEVPGDWFGPVPIPFLTTGVGARFQFAVVPRTPNGDKDLETVAKWLTGALDRMGAGAKTAVGYGRFREPGATRSPESRNAQVAPRETARWVKLRVELEPQRNRLKGLLVGEDKQEAFSDEQSATQLIEALTAEERHRLTGRDPNATGRKRRKRKAIVVEAHIESAGRGVWKILEIRSAGIKAS